MIDSQRIDWPKVNGLLPAIVQDATSLRVLMLGYMNQEALDVTIREGRVTFFSRTRQQLWRKGETSGHELRVKAMQLDCDSDCVLVLAEPCGPTCHRGCVTCFDEEKDGHFQTFPSGGLATLADVSRVIDDRHEHPNEKSYTSSLFAEGLSRMAQKVGEEGVEVALAAATKDPHLVGEAADLLFHLLVLLKARELTLNDVLAELARRRAGK